MERMRESRYYYQHRIFRLPIYSYTSMVFCLFIQTITLPHFRPLPVVISSFQVYHSWKFNNECHFYDCVSSKNTFGSARTHTVFILAVANLAAFCVR